MANTNPAYTSEEAKLEEEALQLARKEGLTPAAAKRRILKQRKKDEKNLR
jgi:hypothetical protein